MDSINVVSSLYDTGRYANDLNNKKSESVNRNVSFEALFQSAKQMVNETNSLTNAAEEEEINYALGISTNTHDLQIAQKKANISLQYTVAVRNGIIDAYREIMNLQF